MSPANFMFLLIWRWLYIMKKNLSHDTLEHLKFEIAQAYGLNRKTDKKSKKNIKNS